MLYNITCVLAALLLIESVGAQPKPVTVGAYYFDGWRDNTNHLTNSLINSYSARKPGWGWNSAGQLQKEIKIASQAGIDYFSFCWYLRSDEQTYRHDKYNQALFEFIKLRGSGLMKFSILVANHEGSLLTPANWPLATQLWIELFKDANFLKVNGEPVISFFSVRSLVEQFGSEREVRKAFEDLRNKALNAGIKGLKIAICVSSIQSECQRAVDAGADILTGYNHAYEGIKKENTRYPIDILRTNSVATWNKIAVHGLPVIPAVTLNWDPRPWSAGNKLLEKSHWFYGYSAASCEQSIRSVRLWINKNEHRNINMAILYAWNEYGEGAWLTPSSSDSLLVALRSGLK